VKVKCCYRPGVAQRVPGGLGSQIFMMFGKWRWWDRQSHAPAAFTPRKYSWYSFLVGAGLIPGPWCGRMEYVTERSSDTTGNQSQYRSSSAVAQRLNHYATPGPIEVRSTCAKHWGESDWGTIIIMTKNRYNNNYVWWSYFGLLHHAANICFDVSE
jgi:hypothetical protein